MKTYTRLLLITASLFAAVSCVDQDYDPGTDCDQLIRIVLDWIDTEPQPETDSVRIAIRPTNGAAFEINSDTDHRDIHLNPGGYNFVGWEEVSNVAVNGTVVSVPVNADGYAMEPEAFAAGQINDNILNIDGYQQVDLPMRRQTRDLIIRIIITGDGIPLLRTISGDVEGIALAREIDFGFRPADGRMRPPAVSEGSIAYAFFEEEDALYEGRNTLLGINGPGTQTLNLEMLFNEGNTNDAEFDITADMTGFHTANVEEPWVIEIQIHIGIDFDMEIVDWNSGAESWLDAE